MKNFRLWGIAAVVGVAAVVCSIMLPGFDWVWLPFRVLPGHLGEASWLVGSSVALAVLWAIVTYSVVQTFRWFIRNPPADRMRRIFLAIGCILFALVVIDRAALAVWRIRIDRLAQRFANSAETKAGDPTSYYHPKRPLVVSTGVRVACAVPLLTVMLDGPKPDQLVVDGKGGLSLVYTPPALAWSRHLPFVGHPRVPIQGSDIYAFNDIYFLSIWTVEPGDAGKALRTPIVKLEHGLPF